MPTDSLAAPTPEGLIPFSEPMPAAEFQSMTPTSIANGDTAGLGSAIDSVCNINGASVTINLAAGGVYTFTSVAYDPFYPTALLVCGDVTIRGNGATIQRAGTSALFRLIGVTDRGRLTLDNVTLPGGRMDANGGAAVVVVGGTASLTNVIVDDNDVNDPQLGVGFLSSGGALYNYFGTLTLVVTPTSWTQKCLCLF